MARLPSGTVTRKVIVSVDARRCLETVPPSIYKRYASRCARAAQDGREFCWAHPIKRRKHGRANR